MKGRERREQPIRDQKEVVRCNTDEKEPIQSEIAQYELEQIKRV